MSHIVEIKTQVRDPVAIAAACNRLTLAPPRTGTAKLFNGAATGVIVELPGWRYPVVFATQVAEARYDNFRGRWGDRAQLDSFLQAYAVEMAKLEARRKGHSTTEQTLPDGSIRLSIQVGGAA